LSYSRIKLNGLAVIKTEASVPFTHQSFSKAAVAILGNFIEESLLAIPQ